MFELVIEAPQRLRVRLVPEESNRKVKSIETRGEIYESRAEMRREAFAFHRIEVEVVFTTVGRRSSLKEVFYVQFLSDDRHYDGVSRGGSHLAPSVPRT